MNKAVITFSFDDARADSYRAIKIADEYGVKSTLNVTTGYVEGINASQNNPTHLPAMNKEQVVELFSIGTEIACHGDTHDNKLSSILHGKDKLYQWLHLTSEQKIGFASPHSMIDISETMIEELIRNNISYLRVGPFVKPLSRLTRLRRKLASITQSKVLFCQFYRDTLMNPIIDGYIVRSVPVMRQNGLEQMKAVVDYAVTHNYWLILMFHSVLADGEEGYRENFSWSLEDYTKLCEYIQSKNAQIECITTIEAFSKIAER